MTGLRSRVTTATHPGARATLERCPRCMLHVRLCLCALVEPDRGRYARGRAAHTAASCTSRRTRAGSCRSRSPAAKCARSARAESSLDTTGLDDPARRTVMLFPTEGSEPLARDEMDARPDHAGRARRRLAPRVQARRARTGRCSECPRVHLPSGSAFDVPPAPAQRPALPRHVRSESRVRSGSWREPTSRARLEHVFRLMVERTLWSRGRSRPET
jgi:hypothetical protein